jgi:hypothetical protein
MFFTRIALVCTFVASLAGCTVSTSEGNAASQKTGATTAPAAVVGTWTAGRGGTTVSYDTITGTSTPANASGLAFLFAADGTFAKAYRDSNGGDCPMIVLATESGTVDWSDGSFQLHSEHGTTKTWGSCGGGMTSQEMPATDLDNERYTFSLDGEELVLTRVSDGASARFHRSQ